MEFPQKTHPTQDISSETLFVTCTSDCRTAPVHKGLWSSSQREEGEEELGWGGAAGQQLMCRQVGE